MNKYDEYYFLATSFNTPHMDLDANRINYTQWYDHKTNPHILVIKRFRYTHGETIPMTLLIPDRDKPQREDFIWALPVARPVFNKWYKLAEKYKGITDIAKMRYMQRHSEGKIKTLLVLPNSSHSDDDVMAACAWLRLVKEHTCKIYVLRCTDDPPKGARLIERVAGCDPALVEDIPEGEERGTDENGEACPTE